MVVSVSIVFMRCPGGKEFAVYFFSHNVLYLDLKNYMKEQMYFVTKNRDSLKNLGRNCI